MSVCFFKESICYFGAFACIKHNCFTDIKYRSRVLARMLHVRLACRRASACIFFQNDALIFVAGPLSSPLTISARRCARAFSTAALTSAFFCRSRILAFISASSFCIAAVVMRRIIPQMTKGRWYPPQKSRTTRFPHRRACCGANDTVAGRLRGAG